MDDQKSSSPMSDFLQSLSKSAVKAAVESAVATPVLTKEPPTDLSSQRTLGSTSDAVIPLTMLASDAKAGESSMLKPEATSQEHKLRVALRALRSIEQNVANIIKLLESDPAVSAPSTNNFEPTDLNMLKELELAGIKQIDGRVVEGVFDGQGMVGSDGQSYTVPPNYASKSKLVEGDLLKLTITPKGSFIYKQIGPIDRSRIVAQLGFDATNGEYYATSEDKRWSVIKASVTYFKGEPNDEVVLLVPKNAPSKWAAVENVVKKNPLA